MQPIPWGEGASDRVIWQLVAELHVEPGTAFPMALVLVCALAFLVLISLMR